MACITWDLVVLSLFFDSDLICFQTRAAWNQHVCLGLSRRGTTRVEWHVCPARKGLLIAPQLQAQQTGLTDRSKLGRLRLSLQATGAWHQVTMVEDLCNTHVSLKWLSHLDACTGSVLVPYDFVVNVQKRPGNRSNRGEGRLCGTFLDSQLPKRREGTTLVYTQCIGA